MAQSRKPSKLTYKQVTRPRVRFNPGSKRHLQAREHEEKALELRKAGYSYKEIGAQLGISRVAAFQSVMRVLAAYEDDIKEQVPRVRQLELQRLDSMLTKLQPRINQGDDRAINSALKIGERRAKLMGLDAPLEIDHSGTIEV
jgi:DNA-binding CsgD family transcriptional regulator